MASAVAAKGGVSATSLAVVLAGALLLEPVVIGVLFLALVALLLLLPLLLLLVQLLLSSPLPPAGGRPADFAFAPTPGAPDLAAGAAPSPGCAKLLTEAAGPGRLERTSISPVLEPGLESVALRAGADDTAGASAADVLAAASTGSVSCSGVPCEAD